MSQASISLSGIVVLSMLCAPAAVVRAQLVPIGGEFLVNVYTTAQQTDALIAADTAGNFVVSWASDGQDGHLFGVFARRYDSAGNALGAEFQVNSYTSYFQYQSAVAVGPGGEFVVTWLGAYSDIAAQRFNSAGNQQGTEFQVNELGGHPYHAFPDVAFNDGGSFVVVWSGYDGSNAGIVGRRVDSGGALLGTEFRVNDFTSGIQTFASVAGAGGFVISWSSLEQDGDELGVFARRYASSGVQLGTEFQVNTYTTSIQTDSDVAAGPAGNFVIVWTSQNQDGSGFGVFAQRFDSVGAHVGSELQINSHTVNNQSAAAVTMSPAGDFVVVWHGIGQDDSNYAIFARLFRSDGSAEGEAVQVNEYTTGFQFGPDVAAGADGTFVVVWESQLQDGSYNGVFARRYGRAGSPVTGKKLLIRTTPSRPNLNKLVYVSADAGFEAPKTVAQDPRCPPVGSGSLSSGARLRVVGPGGDFTIHLPCVSWSVDSTGARYRYRDGSGATCSAVVVQEGRLQKASCKGPQVAYTLGATQGDVHVTLTTGDPASNRKYCATFGPRTSATVVHDGSDGRRFMALNAGPGSCQ